MAEQMASVSGLRWPMTKISLIKCLFGGASSTSPGFSVWVSWNSPLRLLLQRRQDFRRVFFRLHQRPDFFNFSVRPDQKCDAVNAQIFPAHETFLAPHAVSIDNLLVLVREQRERQLEFFHELVVRFHGIGADAQDHRARLFEIGEMVTEGA